MIKLIIIYVCLVTCSYFAQAQNIGIGTSSPDPSAIVQVNSKTQGLLIPSMTTSQRILVSNPAEGLLVYDLSLNRLYQYQSGAWQYVINNDCWVQSANRKWTYNGTDSIGIGTSTPDERLKVSGNILATGDMLLSGAVTTGMLQLQNSGVDKAYLQASGNNLRLGTNSGNSTGNLVIRMNGQDKIFVDEVGRVGIGESNPASRLDVNGSINIAGNLTNASVTGFAPLQPLCYGTVSYNPNTDSAEIAGTPNCSANMIQDQVGEKFKVTCPGVTSNSVVILTIGLPQLRARAELHNGYFYIYTINLDNGETFAYSTQFIVFNQ